MIPEWVEKYVGIPYVDKGRTMAGFDCWGLTREVLTAQYGVPFLPDYVDEYLEARDRSSVRTAIENGLQDGWIRLQQPEPGCLVILRLAGHPWHSGVMVTPEWMLHTLAGVNSCRERIDSITWRNRVEGFYRHAA